MFTKVGVLLVPPLLSLLIKKIIDLKILIDFFSAEYSPPTTMINFPC